MKKALLSFLVLLPAISLSQPKARMLYEAHIPQVVHLKFRAGSCTGFVIKAGVIATAAHCTIGNLEAVATFWDGAKRVFEVRASGIPATGKDWGLMIGDTRHIEPFKFPSAPPPLPFITYAVGYGQGGPQSLVPAVILDPLERKTGLELELASNTDYGDSGGPLLGLNNTVLGIVFAMGWEDGIGYAVPYQALQEALIKNGL